MRALPGEGRLVAAALPLALAPVAATLVFAEQAGVAPTGAALVGFLATQAFDLGWHHASVAVSVTLVAALGLVPVRRAAGAEDGAPG